MITKKCRYAMKPRWSWVALLLLMATSAFASDTSQENTQIETTTEITTTAESPSELENEIDQIKQYISELSVTLKQATGDVRDALQLQLFQKNAELRKSLSKAVEEKQLPKKSSSSW